MKAIWLATTITLFAASAFFSVNLFVQLASTQVSAFVYGAVAVALAMVQYAVLPRAIGHWKCGSKFSASIGFLTWVLLTLLSIAASAAALIGDTKNHQQQSVKSSSEYMLIINQIDQLQQQSSMLQKTALIDTENGYRARAVKTLDKNTGLQKTIAELRGQLSTLQPERSTSATRLFSQIADRTNSNVDTVMSAAYMAVAILIEIALTVSVAALTDRQAALASKAKTKTAPESSAPSTRGGLSIRKIIDRLRGGQPVTGSDRSLSF